MDSTTSLNRAQLISTIALLMAYHMLSLTFAFMAIKVYFCFLESQTCFSVHCLISCLFFLVNFGAIYSTISDIHFSSFWIF